MEFLHIPKTGGTSIVECLHEKTQSWGHYPVNKIPEEKRSTVWSVIRNPYDRAVSIYEYMNRMEPEKLSFKEWWKVNGQNRISNIVADCFIEQTLSYFLCIDGQVAVPHIVEFKEFPAWCEKELGISVPHKNRTTRKRDYKEYYDDESFELITDRFQEDLRTFNYEW